MGTAGGDATDDKAWLQQQGITFQVHEAPPP